MDPAIRKREIEGDDDNDVAGGPSYLRRSLKLAVRQMEKSLARESPLLRFSLAPTAHLRPPPFHFHLRAAAGRRSEHYVSGCTSTAQQPKS